MEQAQQTQLQLAAVPLLSDNYGWILHDGHHALVVDPGDGAPILAWLAQHHMRPVAILITHHHRDHIGGCDVFATDLPLYGPDHPALPARTRRVQDGACITIPELDTHFSVIATPGHTLTHLCYHGADCLFCGDTLFSCGCGRLFEGTPEVAHASLMRLAQLPDHTRICCTHEYTLANLAFTRDLEPHHPGLRDWETEARALRRAGLPTLPVRLADERRRNPFLRCHEPGLQRAIQARSSPEKASSSIPPAVAFAQLRRLKDDWH